LKKVGSATLTPSSGQTVQLTQQLLYLNRKLISRAIYGYAIYLISELFPVKRVNKLKVGSATLTPSSGQTVQLTQQLLYLNRKLISRAIHGGIKVYTQSCK